mmetsp:Transcript_18513/g.29168  ORF Transcript_18513/g.29168 Transcript_18513/m.29168 type:complete len:89 (+) Transcript_18513:330-596(+)
MTASKGCQKGEEKRISFLSSSSNKKVAVVVAALKNSTTKNTRSNKKSTTKLLGPEKDKQKTEVPSSPWKCRINACVTWSTVHWSSDEQ